MSANRAEFAMDVTQQKPAPDSGEDTRQSATDEIIYGVDDNPRWYLLPVFGFQQAILCLTSTLSVPFLITSLICANDLPDVRAKLLSISFFMCGLATTLQNIIGIRLPIIQGGSHVFIPPIIAMMSLESWKCPAEGLSQNTTSSDDAWVVRMRELQGNLMLASLTQVVLGVTGVIGFLLKFIGPLTVAPTISLIGLSLSSVVVNFSQRHWGIALFTMALILLFSLFLGGVELPTPSYTRSKKCHVTKSRVFQLAPILFAVVITWLFCYALTVTDVLAESTANFTNYARTDINDHAFDNAPWFYFPYPLQFGMPTISAAGYVGMLTATISSVIESVGDYFAAARVSGVPSPPPHAINRGIAMEGFSSIISGLIGAGHATTSYSGNIGAIAVTRVASRRAFIAAGVILMICGMVGKIGALVTMMPEPIIGGINAVLLGLVAAVGFSALQFVDMSSSRNLTIFGTSVMLGMALPQWITANPDAIQTGSVVLDQVCTVLLGTAMFVGGVTGCILDNLVPGTPEERGLTKWRQDIHKNTQEEDTQMNNLYDLPLVTKYFRRVKCCSYIPFSPTFDKEFCATSRKRKPTTTTTEKYVYKKDVDIQSENIS